MREDKKGRVKSINYSKKFLKSLKKLSEIIINEAEKKEKIFKENPFNPILKTHKLSGKEKECWSFRVNYSYRIKFIFINDDEVLFLDIGTHDIYK
jgi:addiction module RelE/StbE family toxin